MRSLARPRRREEEEESVFVSMTDMTTSFLFVVMILLAFFASRFTDSDVVPRSRLEASEAARAEAEAQVVQLRAGLEKAEARIVELEAELAAATSERDAAVAEAARLAAALREARAEIAALRERLAQVERERDELLARLAAMDAPDPLEEYLRGVAASRRLALERLRDAIEAQFPDLDPVINSEADALRFEGEGLFASGSSRLAPSRRAVVKGIAESLDVVLPCYTIGPRTAFDPECNPGFAIIEAVQIEGHTDRVGSDLDNMRLSTLRSMETYTAMLARMPGLVDHRNVEEEPVLSVAGYGEDRPVTDGSTEAARAVDRRIDLRFIMLSPSRSEEIAIIRQKLAQGDE